MVTKINKKLLDRVVTEAKESPRKRKNYNFHTDYSDPINRMINAIEPFSYIQPHKHENPDKREVFIVLKGKIAAIFFDDAGEITEHVILDPETGNYGVEIPAGTWHTIISLESGTVVYEVKDGPYQPMDDKNFAAWAPRETDESTEEYLNDICSRLQLTKFRTSEIEH